MNRILPAALVTLALAACGNDRAELPSLRWVRWKPTESNSLQTLPNRSFAFR